MIERISCHNYVEVDGYAFFSNWFYNGLFKVEILTGKAFFLGHFYGEEYSERNLHWEILLKNEKIYFCPWKSRYVHIYNLKEETLNSVEIRRKSEKFFSIEEVFLEENNLFLIPGQTENFIFKLDMNSLEVIRISGRPKFRGASLAECKEVFPGGELVKRLGIERADRFFWRQIYQGVWYGFLPLGRKLLKYTEHKNKIEFLPIVVVNNIKLKEYLYDVEWQNLIEKAHFEESIDISISRLIHILKRVKTYEQHTLRSGKDSGGKIWKILTD